jgi:uncharacterized protein YdeI (YjbR/CyaY-like superfamily)
MNAKIDAYFDRPMKWQEEIKALRRIVLDCELVEELKWGLPCYTLHGGNVVIIQDFKEACALMFFKGALLQDTNRILIPPGNSQAARQIRFASVREVAEMEQILKSYISEAIEVERAGLKVTFRSTPEFSVPSEFQTRLDEDPALKSAFDGLTPGRQRAYLHYFSTPKQSMTRASRVDKTVPQILEGKGLDD